MTLKEKAKEWLRRYSVPLILCTLATLIVTNLLKFVYDNNVIAGIAGTWVNNLVFYGYIAVNDLKKKPLSWLNFIKSLRNLLVEFGPAELLDSFLLRPFYLSVFPYFITNYSLAILLGSLAAEVSYFIPTILSYELRKKLFKD